MDNLPKIFNWFRKKQLLFRLVFWNTEGRQVLEDLAHFCYLDRSTFDPNPTVHAKREGRREVILYILESLNKNVTDIGESNHGSQPTPDEYSIHAAGSGSVHDIAG